MYYEDNIHIQTAHSAIRNKTNVVNTSSDICTFVSPTFSMSGASNLVCSATTGTSHIHLISTSGSTTGGTKDFIFNFDGNISSFDDDTSFKFEIYKYDTESALFRLPQNHVSAWYDWSSFSATSAVTKTITYSDLEIDGDYLIKGFYTHGVCTEFASRLDLENDTSSVRTGEEFGLFQPNVDYFMSIVRQADKPIFGGVDGDTSEIRALQQISVIPNSGQTEFILNSDIGGDYIITLNGATLAKDLDYSATTLTAGTQPIVITLFDEAKSTDVFTYIFTSSELGNGLKTDEINVTSIPSGPTDGEGSNEVYLNTTTSMYEIYTSLTPNSSDSILVSINGVRLASGIDYYQSTSNPNRIILEGMVLIDDVITITYNQNATYVEGIGLPLPQISWYIQNQPTTTDGLFTLEFATDEEMTALVSTASTIYEINQSTYSATATLVGDVGDRLYYRVKNYKSYTTLCGTLVESTAYSDVIPITITTNSINSY